MPRRLARAILAAALTLITQAGPAQAPPAASAPVPVTADNFVRAESDLYFAAIVQKGGFGRFFHDREPAPIACADRHPHEPGHALFGRRLRPRCRPGRRSPCPMPAAASSRCRSSPQDHYTTGVSLRRRQAHPHAAGGRHALRRRGHPHAGRSGAAAGPGPGACAAGCDQGRAARQRTLRGAGLGSRKPGQGARAAARPRRHPSRHAPHVRHARGGRPGAAPHRQPPPPGAATPSGKRSTSTSCRPE